MIFLSFYLSPRPHTWCYTGSEAGPFTLSQELPENSFSTFSLSPEPCCVQTLFHPQEPSKALGVLRPTSCVSHCFPRPGKSKSIDTCEVLNTTFAVLCA